MVSRWLPVEYTSLGTDGFGRSDTREALRSFFEIDPPHIAAATLSSLARSGALSARKASRAIRDLGVATDTAPPFAV
jgi:pyruvate dehydrogenase E1 component